MAEAKDGEEACSTVQATQARSRYEEYWEYNSKTETIAVRSEITAQRVMGERQFGKAKVSG